MDKEGQPDAIHLLVIRLNESLNLETKYQPFLELPSADQNPSDCVAPGIRDGSAHVLRCLKVWYDLPSEVLFVAINVMDRFLTKMKVRPKHMACISISAFQLAAHHVSQHQPMKVPDPSDLAAISQCKCTPGDLSRMEGIIAAKLGYEPAQLPVTPLDSLRLLDSLFAAVAARLGSTRLYERATAAAPTVWLSLEILACDAACSNFRPSELALVLLCSHLDRASSEMCPAQDPDAGAHLVRLAAFGLELQKLCNISDESFFCCQEVVLSILARYNAQCQMPHRQRLVWRLSQRTLRYLRPTDKLTCVLPTIREDKQVLRSRSGSVSSDGSCDSEKEDPTSEWCQDAATSSMNPKEWSKAPIFPLAEEEDCGHFAA